MHLLSVCVCDLVAAVACALQVTDPNHLYPNITSIQRDIQVMWVSFTSTFQIDTPLATI